MRFSGHQVELYDWLNQHTTGLAGDLDKEESIEPWQQPYDGLEHKPTLFGLNRFQLYKIMGVFLSGVFSGVFFSPVLFLLGAAATTAYSGRLLYRSYRRGLLSERREAITCRRVAARPSRGSGVPTSGARANAFRTDEQAD